MQLVKNRLAAFAVLALGTLVAPALADSYEYTGNDYNVVNSPFTSTESIDGSFTVDGSLAANLSDVNIASTLVTGFDFSDGVDTFSNAAGSQLSYLWIWTDASGDITKWSLLAYTGPQDSDSIAVFYEPGSPSNDSPYDRAEHTFTQAEAVEEPGTWTKESAPVVPEPSSLALFGTGALGLIAAARRRLSSTGR